MSSAVSTTHGRVRGQENDGVTRFLGIPYAASPTGALRFRAPAPPPPWEGILEADAFSATPPKPDYAAPFDVLLAEPSIPGDDWLTVNVWTPGGSGLPVMVWIHGGAFSNGNSAVPMYDGHTFARDGVVLVTINYRLGVDGFGYLPDAPANRGLLDQIAALEWVRDNIAAFGGDPGNVTIFGESAGAMSITTLLSIPRARGLFAKAITQSGAAQAASVPVIDGDLIPAHPMAAIAAGAGAEVPLLTGTTSEEYRLFLFPTGLGALITDEILSGLLPALGVGAPLAGLHRSNRPGATPGDIMAALVTDKFFRLPALAVAEARTSGPAPTYVYEFAWQSPVGDLGACHSLEIPFVFDNLSASGAALVIGEDRPQHLASQMHTAWIRFARDGDPGWRAFDKDYPVRIFGAAGPAAEAVETVELDPRGDERRIWSNPSPEVA